MNAKEYRWITETLHNLKRYSDGCGFRGLSDDLKKTIVHFEYEYAESQMSDSDGLLYTDTETIPTRKH